jgi:hypothetical protein
MLDENVVLPTGVHDPVLRVEPVEPAGDDPVPPRRLSEHLRSGPDLTDYCVRHLAKVLSDQAEEQDEDPAMNRFKEETIAEEIKRHDRTTEFQVG